MYNRLGFFWCVALSLVIYLPAPLLSEESPSGTLLYSGTITLPDAALFYEELVRRGLTDFEDSYHDQESGTIHLSDLRFDTKSQIENLLPERAKVIFRSRTITVNRARSNRVTSLPTVDGPHCTGIPVLDPVATGRDYIWTLDEVVNDDPQYGLIAKFAAACPGIVTVETRGSADGIPGLPDLGPFPIKVLKITSDLNPDAIKPAVLFNSVHHAKEVMTLETTLDIVYQLLLNYDPNDPENSTTKWIDNNRIFIVPIVNPAGFEVNHLLPTHDWRKNVRDNNDSDYFEEEHDGVDLNRNYPFHWGGNVGGSGTDEGSNSYRGPNAHSEPEVQTMIDLADEIRPMFNISYHSKWECLFYGMNSNPELEYDIVLDGQLYSLPEILGLEVAANLFKFQGSQVPFDTFRRYSTSSNGDGYDRDYHLFRNGTISFVVEIVPRYSSYYHWPPSYQYSYYYDNVTQKQRGGWQLLLDRAGTQALHFQVFDHSSGVPIDAEIEIDQFHFYNGEVLRTNEFGSFHIPVHVPDPALPTTYTGTIKAPGYHDFPFSVTSYAPDGSFPASCPFLQKKEEVLLFGDDFESDQGWVTSHTSASGHWVREDPRTTAWPENDPFDGSTPNPFSEHFYQPSTDRSHLGKHAFVTGNTPEGPVDDNPLPGEDYPPADDVNQGEVVLESPIFAASGRRYIDISLFYKFYITAGEPGYFKIDISSNGGASYTNLASYTESSAPAYASEQYSRFSKRLYGTPRLYELQSGSFIELAELTQLIGVYQYQLPKDVLDHHIVQPFPYPAPQLYNLTNNMRLRVRVGHTGGDPEAIVEAALDDVRIYGSSSYIGYPTPIPDYLLRE